MMKTKETNRSKVRCEAVPAPVNVGALWIVFLLEIFVIGYELIKIKQGGG